MPHSILCVIPARSGSRGLRHKNIQKVGGVPMLVRAVKLAQASVRRGEDWQILVNTDSPDYARLARRAGARVLVRPRRLASATARLIDVVLDTLERHGSGVDSVLMLSAATPLTEVRDVRRAIVLHKRHGGSVVSVTREPVPDEHRFAVREGRLVVPPRARISRRQESEPRFRLNGAIYLASVATLRRNQQFVGPKTRVVVMPRDRSVDVDEKLDLDWSRFLCGRRGENGPQRV